MSKDLWSERERGAEEDFFNRENRVLAEKLRLQSEREKNREELAAALGIKDIHLLDILLSEHFTAATISALTLVPLVRIAWADQKVDSAEREAVLSAGQEQGIGPASPAQHLLAAWLREAPSRELSDAWQSYIAILRDTMDPSLFVQLGLDLIRHARQVANASGGFLGLGNKISQVESKEIRRIAQIFNLTDI